MTILLTGASGFVGKAVLKNAQKRELKIRPVFRSMDSASGHSDVVLISDLNENVDWSQALKGVDVVLHLAARAHVMNEELSDPISEYRRVNVYGTLNLARQAAAGGVRRFIFISSVKVNGESTEPSHPFTADDTPAPEDDYGQSKAEAEALLKQLAERSGMELTIIRPPLVYGRGVKGNFASLINLVRSGIPLPFGDVINNKRSLVGLDNLVDLILICVHHTNAANQTFLISDGEEVSTAELISMIGAALGQKTRLYRIPIRLISLIASLVGRKETSKRLIGSLQVDITKTCQLLDWKPSVSLVDGLRRAME